VKHGGETYILGKADARVRQIDEVRMNMSYCKIIMLLNYRI